MPVWDCGLAEEQSSKEINLYDKDSLQNKVNFYSNTFGNSIIYKKITDNPNGSIIKIEDENAVSNLEIEYEEFSI